MYYDVLYVLLIFIKYGFKVIFKKCIFSENFIFKIKKKKKNVASTRAIPTVFSYCNIIILCSSFIIYNICYIYMLLFETKGIYTHHYTIIFEILTHFLTKNKMSFNSSLILTYHLAMPIILTHLSSLLSN